MKLTLWILVFSTGLIFSANIYSQKPEEHVKIGKEAARQELKYALEDTSSRQPFVFSNKSNFFEDSATAIAMVEPLLFKIFGKENIIDEKPYEAYLINDYWVIMGTMEEHFMGGVFEVIMDAGNGRIIRITHGQ